MAKHDSFNFHYSQLKYFHIMILVELCNYYMNTVKSNWFSYFILKIHLSITLVKNHENPKHVILANHTFNIKTIIYHIYLLKFQYSTACLHWNMWKCIWPGSTSDMDRWTSAMVQEMGYNLKSEKRDHLRN